MARSSHRSSSSSSSRPRVRPMAQPMAQPMTQPTSQPMTQPLSSSGGVIGNIATIASAHLISTGISNILFGTNKDNTTNTTNTTANTSTNTNTSNTTNVCNDFFQKYQECMKVHSEFDANQCKILYDDFQKCSNSFNKT